MRNQKLTEDNKIIDTKQSELISKLQSVQSMFDRQLVTIQKLEDDQAMKSRVIDENSMKLRELSKKDEMIKEKDREMQRLKCVFLLSLRFFAFLLYCGASSYILMNVCFLMIDFPLQS